MRDLFGGSPQGSLVGQDSYIVTSNDNTDGIEDEEDIFKYIDNLNNLEIVLMANLLQEYQYLDHVPDDIGVNDLFCHHRPSICKKNLIRYQNGQKKI